jgi:hypothetical protein
VQKYGFTLRDNTHNKIIVQIPYREYESVVTEE